MRRTLCQKLLFTVLAFLLSGTVPVFADEDPLDSLGFLDKSEQPPVSTPHSPRPPSLIAENVTVVTASDIARLNAHTLDEVLQTVSGFQLFQVRTPGSAVPYTLNGALSSQVMILIDGVPQNLLGTDDSSDLGMIPVQRIERIEIIKGAASVAWGPALGGAVNIITRNPEPDSKLVGSGSASYGSHGASDLRGGVSGTTDRLGYYLDGGRFNSTGLLPGNPVSLNHAIGKITYDLPSKGRLTFAADHRDRDFGYGYGDRATGLGDTLVTAGSRYTSAYLRFDYPLQDRLNIELLSSVGQKDVWRKYTMPGDLLIFDAKNRTDSQQVTAKLIWGDRSSNLAAGIEYLHDNISVSEPKNGFSFLNFSRDLDRYAAYLNGSYSLGPVTLLSGLRLDHIGINDMVTSYHLGATWQLTENTLLRAYAVKGYSLPMPNFKDSLQNIFTLQSGIETSAIPLLWLKGTFFYSNTWNIETFVVPQNYPASPVSTVDSEEVRQGFEVEGRTVPWNDFSLRAGFTYSDVHDKKTDARISYIPIGSTKIALDYDNAGKGLRATITGSHVNWPSAAGNSVHDRQIIWDLHLTQKIPSYRGMTPELFFSGRNLFNSSQYIDNFRTNTPIWLEGGVRVSF